MLGGDFTTFESPTCNNGQQKTLLAPFGTGGFAPNTISPSSFSRGCREYQRRASAQDAPAHHMLAARLPCSGAIYPTENDNQAPVRVRLSAQRQADVVCALPDHANQQLTGSLLAEPQSAQTEATPGFNDQSQSFALGDTYIVNSNMVNSLRASVNRIASLKPGANMFGAPDVGIHMFSYLPNYLQTVVTGEFTLGSTTKDAFACVRPAYRRTTLTFSIVHGAHLFAFGGYYTRANNNLLAQAFADGQFQFGGGVGLD